MFNLLPQAIDVRVDISLITFVLRAPHFVEQFVARPRATRLAGEAFENLKLERREFDERAVERHLVAAFVYNETSDLDALRRLLPFALRLFAHACRTAQQSLYAQ